jgi:hypothetical protein
VNEEFSHRFDELVVLATITLFAESGVSLVRVEAAPAETPPDHDIAASIGFASAEVRGALAFTTRRSLVAASWPEELRARSPSDAEVADWCGELSNQLLGRLKNRLLDYDLALEQGTPSVVSGWHLHRSPARTNLARSYAFRFGEALLLVYLDMEIPIGFTMVGDPHARPASEGRVMIFK